MKNDPKREEQPPRTPRSESVALVDRLDRMLAKSTLPVRTKLQCLQFVLSGVQMNVLDEPTIITAKP